MHGRDLDFAAVGAVMAVAGRDDCVFGAEAVTMMASAGGDLLFTRLMMVVGRCLRRFGVPCMVGVPLDFRHFDFVLMLRMFFAGVGC